MSRRLLIALGPLLAWALVSAGLLSLLAYKEPLYRFYERELGIGQKPEFDLYWRVRDTMVNRRLPLLQPGYVLFIGDSHLDGLAVSELAPRSFNAAIGGDTSTGVAGRLAPFLAKDPAAVVLSVGLNDQRYRSAETAAHGIAAIADAVGPDRSLLLLTVLPVDPELAWQSNQYVDQINTRLRDVAADRPWVRLIDSVAELAPDGSLLARWHIGDGVHLNAAAQERLARLIRDGLRLELGEVTGFPLPHRDQ